MTAPATPVMGIRLKDGAEIPPAPSLGVHLPVPVNGGPRLGFTNENRPGQVVAVCGECRTILDPCPDYQEATLALHAHWERKHQGVAR